MWDHLSHARVLKLEKLVSMHIYIYIYIIVFNYHDCDCHFIGQVTSFVSPSPPLPSPPLTFDLTFESSPTLTFTFTCTFQQLKGLLNFSSKRKYKKLEIDRYHEVNKNINKRKSIWEFLPHPRLYIFSIVVSMWKCHGIPQAKIPTGVILQKVVPSPLGIVATIMFRWRRQNFWMKRSLNSVKWTSKVRGNLHQGSGHYLTL